MKAKVQIHIILARETKTAVVIRHGPEKWVCILLWDRRTDKFEIGQWLYGSIDGLLSDLSPDGKHFLYHARDFKWKKQRRFTSYDEWLQQIQTRRYPYAWTAIAVAPYIKAIGFWPNAAGGFFMSNKRYWLNGGITPFMGYTEDQLPPHEEDRVPSHQEDRVPPNLSRQKDMPFDNDFGTNHQDLYYFRLQRDGWRLTGREKNNQDDCTLFEKDLTQGWKLCKNAHWTSRPAKGKGCYHETYSLHHAGQGRTLDFPDWEWADLDWARLVWTQDGILSASNITSSGLGPIQQLHDFNPMTFEPIKAPY